MFLGCVLVLCSMRIPNTSSGDISLLFRIDLVPIMWSKVVEHRILVAVVQVI